MYDMRTCELRHVLTGHTAWINDVALTEGGALCATASGEPVSRVYDLARGECVRLLEGHAAEIHSVAMTRRGRFVVTGSEDGTARVWDLHAARRAPVPRHAGVVHATLATADGARVVTGGRCLSSYSIRGGCFVGLYGWVSCWWLIYGPLVRGV